jgi:hypothetical protein
VGLPLKSLQGFGVPAESYGFANKRLAWETIAPLLERASPLCRGRYGVGAVAVLWRIVLREGVPKPTQ